MPEALDSIDRGPPPRPRVEVSLVRVRVSVGRYVWQRLRLILSFARVRCCIWTFLLAAVSFYPFVGSPVALVFDVIPTKSEKSLEFLFRLSLVGSAAFDF